MALRGIFLGGGGPADSRFAAIENPGAGCTLDGIPTSCDLVNRLMGQGALEVQYQYLQMNRKSGRRPQREHIIDYGLGLYAFYAHTFVDDKIESRIVFFAPQRIIRGGDSCVDSVVDATFKPLRDAARESVPLLLSNAGAAGLTRAQAAYVLASAMGESQMGNRMTEGWGPTDAQKKYEPPSKKATQLGNTQKGDGYLFRGRGYVQITGRGNYQYWADRLGVDMVGDPDLALVPENAAQIAVYGMQEGTFTRGRERLADYINDDETDFVGARAIVNGSDRANTFAGYANNYLRALDRCQWSPPVHAPIH